MSIGPQGGTVGALFKAPIVSLVSVQLILGDFFPLFLSSAAFHRVFSSLGEFTSGLGWRGVDGAGVACAQSKPAVPED